MADYRILLEADTAQAERDLRRVDTVANTAAKTRKLEFKIPDLESVQTRFGRLKDGIETAANNIRTFYNAGKLIPGVGEKVQQVEDAFNGTSKAAGKAFETINGGVGSADILRRVFSRATDGLDALLAGVAKVGLALYAIEKIVNVVQSAFGKFFAETIGREIAFRETLLQTQTTLASMSDVFVGGKQVIDPLEKIRALTKSVEKNVDSIRERSLELAGVTSSEVVEVFGIVASQIGQVGGGLQDAEDLAISFAAALGTFRIPLQQARQEITSMLQGNIGADSYLARALGITNADIAKARTQAGGVVQFIQEKLATAVAGQKLAAQSFSGIVSNIRELGELVAQRFGRGLLDPLLAGLTATYTALSTVKTTLYELAETAGRTVGAILRLSTVDLFSGIFGNVDVTATLTRVAEQAKAVATTVFAELGRITNNTIQALIQAINAIQPAIFAAGQAFMILVKAFAELKVGQFQAVVSALANIVSAVSPAINIISGLVNVWAKFLDLPIIQYVSEVATVLGLLKRMGLDAALGIASFANFLLSAGVPAIARIGVAVGGFIVTLGLLVASVGKVALSIAALAGAFLTPAAAIPALQAGLAQFIASLRAAGVTAQQAAGQMGVLGAGMQATGAAAKGMGIALLTSLGQFALIQIAIAAAVDLFGRFQRAQQDAADQRQFETSLAYLEKNAKAAAAGLDAATQATYDYHKAQAQQQVNKNIEEIQRLDEQIQQLERALEGGKKGMEGFLHWIRYGGGGLTETYRKKLEELKGDKVRLRAEIERVIAALKAEAEAEAKAYANSPKGKIEQKMKEAQLASEIQKINQQIAQNAILQSQLAGEITEKEAKRRESYLQLNALIAEISTKQGLMSNLLDPRLAQASTEEVKKLKGELAVLENKKITLQIAINKEKFEEYVANLERSTQARVSLLDNESKILQNNLSVVQSFAQAEQGRLNYLLQGLEYAKQNAATDAERIQISEQIAQIQKRLADSQYMATQAAIQASMRQAEIEQSKLQIKEAELTLVVQTAKAQGLLTQAHQDALRVASDAVRLGASNLEAIKSSAKYQLDAADWTRKGAYFAADAALKAERRAAAEKNAANSAGQYANNLERANKAAANMGVIRQQYEGWQEKMIAEARRSAIKNSLSKDFYRQMSAANAAEVNLSQIFGKAVRESAEQADAKAKQEFIDKYGPIGYFASGGMVSKPTLALIGEGGESEYIIPASKMPATVANYQRGKRGASAIPGSAMTSSSARRSYTTTGAIGSDWNGFTHFANMFKSGGLQIPAFATGGYVGSITNVQDPKQNLANIVFNKKLKSAQDRGALLEVPMRPVTELTAAATSLNGAAQTFQQTAQVQNVPTSAPPQININTGPVLQFNGDEYVKMSQFRQGLQQVADEIYSGLRKPSTRTALGLS